MVEEINETIDQEVGAVREQMDHLQEDIAQLKRVRSSPGKDGSMVAAPEIDETFIRQIDDKLNDAIGQQTGNIEILSRQIEEIQIFINQIH